MKVAKRPPHGTRKRYQGTRKIEGCKCDACKAANNEYMRDYKKYGANPYA